MMFGLIVPAPPVVAAPGDLDPSFGNGGVVQGDRNGRYDNAVLQSDGKVVVVGSTGGFADAQVSRYTSAGQLDAAFGDGGQVVTDFGLYESANTVAMQAGGKILVAVNSTADTASFDRTFWVYRYTSTGRLDTTFGTEGRAALSVSWVRAMTVQPDGRILVAGGGRGESSITRLEADGSPDPTFRQPGFESSPYVQMPTPMYVSRVVVLPDGRIVVAGPRATPPLQAPGGIILRLTGTGAIDTTFGHNGLVETAVGPGVGPISRGMVIQPDGRIVLAGKLTGHTSDPRLSMARYLPDGRPDLSFGLGGQTSFSMLDAENVDGAHMELTPDGSFFVAGWARKDSGGSAWVSGRAYVAHVGPDGTLDLRFGAGGVFVASPEGDPAHIPVSVLVQPDGAPLVVAWAPTSAKVLFRLLPPAAGDPVFAWGWNGWGQLGDNTKTARYSAVPVVGRADDLAVAAGAYHSLSLDGNGTVWAWGWNGLGQLGDGTTAERTRPVRVANLTGVVAIAAGAYHSLAVKSDGSVWAWGWNGLGQLGDGTTVDRLVPTRVVGLTDITGVRVGGGAYHSLLLASDGTVRSWGWNGWSQLGDGTATERHTPVAVAGLSDVASVAGGAYHSLALRADGSVLSWGWNGLGQLGDGTTMSRSQPVAATGLPPVAALASGPWYHSAALGKDGSAWTWGWNGFGQLGDGTTQDRHTPVPVMAPGALAAVSGGAFHTVGLSSSRSLRTWGWNAVGQLGDGTTIERHIPTAVTLPGGATGAVISGGIYHTVAG